MPRLPFFFAIPFMLSTAYAHAVTLSEPAFIAQRIARSKPVQIEKLAEVFGNSPAYRFECFEGDVEKPRSQLEAEQILSGFTPKAQTSGVIEFRLDARAYGFDLGFVKKLDQSPPLLPENILNATAPQSLDCRAATDEKAEPSSCTGVFAERTMQADVALSENFRKGLEISESVDISIFSNRDLYMTYKLDFMATQLGRFGQKTGTVTLSKTYLCALKPI